MRILQLNTSLNHFLKTKCLSILINQANSPGILGIFKGKDGKKKYKAENFRSYLDGHP